MRKLALSFGLALLACAPIGPGGRPDPDAVVVYTSLYPEVIEALRPVVEKQAAAASPGVKVVFVQGGSERLAKRVDRELSEHRCPADLLLTSDPAHYRKLEAAGVLVHYESPQAARLPPDLRGPSGAWATARFSTMVIGLAGSSRAGVRSFRDLVDPDRAFKVSIGDPDFSGTNLTTVARLSKRLGWGWYESLKARKAVVAGSNAMVMERLTTGTTDGGVVLLENLLAAKAKGEKVSVVFPTDGAVVVPGPIALLPHANRSRHARAVYDAFLSPPVQQAIAEKGFMHAADPDVPPPSGAPPLEKLLVGAPLSSTWEPVDDSDAVRKKFASIFD